MEEISSDEVGKILTHLNIEIKSLGEANMVLTPPSYRGDLKRAADIYEEVIRMYGFENIEAKIPWGKHRTGKRKYKFYYFKYS